MAYAMFSTAMKMFHPIRCDKEPSYSVDPINPFWSQGGDRFLEIDCVIWTGAKTPEGYKPYISEPLYWSADMVRPNPSTRWNSIMISKGLTPNNEGWVLLGSNFVIQLASARIACKVKSSLTLRTTLVTSGVPSAHC